MIIKSMKVFCLLTVIALFGCGAKQPKQTQPKGALTPIFETQHERNERI